MSEQASTSNEHYADKLIEFLQKRNRSLSVIWPILMVLTVITSGFALYFFQTSYNSQTQLASVQSKFDIQSELIARQKNSLSELEQEKSKLDEELEALAARQASLDTEQTSKLEISGQIIETLKANVAALEEEVRAREDETALLREALATSTASQSEKNQFVQSSTATIKALRTTQAELNDKLNASKTAYTALAKRHKETKSEMNMLADQLSRKTQDLAARDRSTTELRRQLVASQQELGSIKAEFEELEQNLANMVAPIKTNSQMTNKASKNQSNSTANQYPDTNVVEKRSPETSVEAISAPEEKENTNDSTGASFDFDQVAIERP